MSTNTSEIINRGMECLLSKMNVVDVERFIFLLKAEGFDYTEWQRSYFGNMTRQEIDSDMDRFFAAEPYRGETSEIL